MKGKHDIPAKRPESIPWVPDSLVTVLRTPIKSKYPRAFAIVAVVANNFGA